MSSVEVCFSPPLYQYKLTKDDFVTVVVDVLRATTSICAALDYGIKEILPVKGVDVARKKKEAGYIVACERDGKVLDFADIGNSASDFRKDELIGKTVVFSTTNGTQAIKMSADADQVLAGAFSNLDALSQYLLDQKKNVVILCSAWKNLVNLEDSVFAGALAAQILQNPAYDTECDSAKASLDLWQQARHDLKGYLSKASHRHRLKHLVSDEDWDYTVRCNTAPVIPVYENEKIISLNR